MTGLAETQAIQEFVDQYGLDFPQAVSDDGTLWAQFGVFGTGQWYFLNSDGSAKAVPYDLMGDTLAAELDEMLAK